MKKFVNRLAVFLTIIALVTLAADLQFMKMDKRDPDFIKRFDDMPDKIKVCNFGSSHGEYAFNYEDVESKDWPCFNFAFSSQYYSYDYRLMQQYGDHIEEGTIVFIPVSYFLMHGKAEEEDDSFEAKNKRYYKVLSPRLIKNYDFKTDVVINYFPIFDVTQAELLKTLSGKSKSEESFESIWAQISSDIDVSEDATSAYERHIVNGKKDENNRRIVNQEEVDALYDMIDFCRQKGARPILVTTPYLAEYTDKIAESDPAFYDDFYGIVDEVVDKTGVEYYDYARDERFAHRYDWFINADHLNKQGARAFTNILMEEAVNKED